MARPIYGQDDWPRNFPGWMYLGTFIHFLNLALHADAERDDVVLAPYFEDRRSGYNPALFETFEEQQLTHQRAMMARGAALKALRDGLLAPTWLDRDGAFQPVAGDAWQAGATDDDLSRMLVRFSLPDRLIPQGEVAVFGNAPSLYVPAEQAAIVITSINSQFHVPAPPSKILERMGASAPAFEGMWSLAASAVWTATRDLTLARGANSYTAEMVKVGFSSVRDGALEMLARGEIAYHYCRCRRPVCMCWGDALHDIASRAKVNEIVAEGFLNDAGNQDPVPKGAWAGTINFGEGASLEPAKPGGDRWTHIVLPAADTMRLFPPAPVTTAPAEADPETVVNAPAVEHVSADRGAAMGRFAERLDSEGIAIRGVKTAHIAERWDSRDGPAPKVSSITEMMTGGRRGRPRSGKTSDV